ERIDFMLKDSGAGLLVTVPGSANQIIYEKSIVLIPDAINRHFVPTMTGPNPNLHLSPAPVTSMAYLIYTSGSTGKPKGVLIEHQGFINLIYVHREVFGETYLDRMSQVASPSFDAMALEVWPCLLNGAALCIADNTSRQDPVKLKDWLIKNMITITFQPPLMATRLLEEEWRQGTVPRIMRTGGDRLTRYPPRDCPFRLFNLYGPTEDTVCTTWTEIKPGSGPAPPNLPSIGKPIANHQVYILGKQLEVQPLGVPGELCISGRGLARGYLNNPE
ncbi:MAG: AMP-binding protein, partial [bacterium]|nr:AMP-binding protein [bacterium]